MNPSSMGKNNFDEKTVQKTLKEQRKIIQELTEQHEKYTLIYQNTDDLVSLATFDHRVIYNYVNPAHYKILGYQPVDLVGHSAFSFLHPDDKKILIPLLKKYIKFKAKTIINSKQNHFSEKLSFRFRNKQGQWHYMESTVNVVKNEILFISKDVTEKKKLMNNTQKHLKMLHFLNDTLLELIDFPMNQNVYQYIAEKIRFFVQNPASIITINSYDYQTDMFTIQAMTGIQNKLDILMQVFNHKIQHTQIKLDNPKLKTILLSNQLTLWEDSLPALAPHFFNKKISQLIDKYLQVQKIYLSGFHRGKNLFGSIAITLPEGNQLNNREALTVFLRQVSIILQHREAIINLRESTEKLNILFDYAPDAYYISDEKGHFIDGNRAAENLIGYKKEEIIGKNFLHTGLLSDKEIPKTLVALQKNILGKSTGPSEFKLIHRERHSIPVEISTYPVKIKGKLHVLGIARDISLRKKTMEALHRSHLEFSRLFYNNPEASVYIDKHGTILKVNPKFTQIFGYQAKEVIGKDINSGLIHPDNKIKEGKELNHIALNRDYYQFETIRRRKDGTLFPVLASASPIKIDGQPQGLFIQYQDFTERKRGEKIQNVLYRIANAANSSVSLNKLYSIIHQNISQIIDAGNFYICLLDELQDQINFVYFIDEYHKTFPPNIQFSTSRNITSFLIHRRESLLLNYQKIIKLVQQQKIKLSGKVSQEICWLGVPLKVKNKVMGALVIQNYHQKDIYSQKDVHLMEFVSNQIASAIHSKQTEEKLKYLGLHDHMTGLPNRLLLSDRLKMALLQAERKDKKLGVLLFDLNGFKQINDTCGHDAGDQFLMDMAKRLTKTLRKSDTLARTGGDEFVLILPNLDNRQSASQIAHKLIKVIKEPFQWHFYQLKISASIGIAFYPDHGKNIKLLLKAADKAMYLAKKNKTSVEFSKKTPS